MILKIHIFSILTTLFCQLQALKYEYVTCGSLIKLLNQAYDVRLHSHEVAYGTGSGQQSVTAVEDDDDSNSYWQIRGPDASNNCKRGEPIECGSKIRMTHLNTRKNLHTHQYRSPLSSQQEVSAFGANGEGDELDVWEVQCNTGSWTRQNTVTIYHPETNRFLGLSGKIFGRPIANQMEVIGSKSQQKWAVAEGVYIKPTLQEEDFDGHDEL